uniref:Uncharacterized protein n=1 Tax=Pararge aegeria TaxID=116150 RepID=S4NQ54_9NEOP
MVVYCIYTISLANCMKLSAPIISKKKRKSRTCKVGFTRATMTRFIGCSYIGRRIALNRMCRSVYMCSTPMGMHSRLLFS